MKSRMALMVIAASLATFGISSYAFGIAARQTPSEEIRSQLKNAATAEESFRTAHDSYTRRMVNLEKEGFVASEDVRVLIVRGNVNYCLEGQHDALGVIWHYNSEVGQPERGRCARS